MPRRGHIRHGSLQFYPRKRAGKILPRVSWNSLTNLRDGSGLSGFIGYKVGMSSAYVKDNNPSSMTKGQRIIIPVTILEFPSMKIFSVRFYKHNKVIGEILNQNLDKEVKKKVKIPKEIKKKVDDFISKNSGKFDDLRIIAYSQVKKTGLKKKPDFSEIGLNGKLEDKLAFVKDNLSKELRIKDFIDGESIKKFLLDVRGVTKGKGLQGPTKRFGLTLNFHKKEKGQRGPGSGGPWHPARTDYTQPMAGQMGFFTRVIYNNKILFVGDIKELDINTDYGFKRYGKIRNDYMLICGSVQGPSKRQLMVTLSFRPTKNQLKKNYEFLELR